jgi:hypothetical protein
MTSGGDDDFRIGGPDEWSGALTVDRHACGLHLQEQQSLVPDGTATTSAGSSLETAARALLRSRPRRSGLPGTARSPAPARRR